MVSVERKTYERTSFSAKNITAKKHFSESAWQQKTKSPSHSHPHRVSLIYFSRKGFRLFFFSLIFFFSYFLFLLFIFHAKVFAYFFFSLIFFFSYFLFLLFIFHAKVFRLFFLLFPIRWKLFAQMAFADLHP
jgi:hypothetical protein